MAWDLLASFSHSRLGGAETNGCLPLDDLAVEASENLPELRFDEGLDEHGRRGERTANIRLGVVSEQCTRPVGRQIHRCRGRYMGALAFEADMRRGLLLGYLHVDRRRLIHRPDRDASGNADGAVTLPSYLLRPRDTALQKRRVVEGAPHFLWTRIEAMGSVDVQVVRTPFNSTGRNTTRRPWLRAVAVLGGA